MTDPLPSRERVLTRIRKAKATMTEPAIARDYRNAGDHDGAGESLIDVFIDRLIDYRAEVTRVVGDDQVTDAVSAIVGREQARTVVLAAGYPAGWNPKGADLVVDGFGQDGATLLSTTELDGIDAVLTTCAVAVAETGTIVLDGGPGQGRRAITLLPDLHIVVVRADQVVPRVPDALPLLDPRRPLTWISGPSATSDIELNRVEGVHGPRRLRVVIVD
jgi:L-lactate dehydrogenase complex protein LldG